MDIRKLAAMALSAVLAAAVLVPAPALAVNTANAENPSDGTTPEVTGSANVTQLTLIAEDPDANLASNGGTTWVAEHAKVQVPVAINFVVESDGDILGPTQNANITNYSSFPVSVANIRVTGETGVAFAPSAAEANSADEIYLSFKPSGTNTTAVVLSGYTGNGHAPTAGQWDIGAATTGAGTSLGITDFQGHIGGFSAINPLSADTFGHIEWTIKAGSAATAPNISMMNANQLQAAGNAIRGGNAKVRAQYEAAIGQTITVTLDNGNDADISATVRLVDVSTDKGLVFMFTNRLPVNLTRPVEYGRDATSNWSGSALKADLNTNDRILSYPSIYEWFFAYMRINGAVVTPYTVTNKSLSYNGGNPQVITTSDKYWAPSVVEIYGSWPAGSGYSGDEGSSQFAFFARNGISLDNCSGLRNYLSFAASGLGNAMWLRSSSQSQAGYYATVNGADGSLGFTVRDADISVVPCFAL